MERNESGVAGLREGGDIMGRKDGNGDRMEGRVHG